MAQIKEKRNGAFQKTVIAVTDGVAIPRKKDTGLFTAWRISFIGAVAAIVFLVVFKKDPYLAILKFLPDGILVTFQVTVEAIFLAVIIGLFTGLGRLSKHRIINGIASVYVEVVRGIPLLVQLFYIYFALGRIVNLPAVASAVIAMAICYGAYMGEIFRAGIASIPRGTD